MRVRMGPTIGTIARISRWRNCLEKARLTNLHSREVLSLANLLLCECNRNEDPEDNSISAPKPVHPSRDPIHLDWCAIRHKMKIPSPQTGSARQTQSKRQRHISRSSIAEELRREIHELYCNCVVPRRYLQSASCTQADWCQHRKFPPDRHPSQQCTDHARPFDPQDDG